MENIPEIKKRPDWLTFICILSFVAGSFELASNFNKFQHAATVSAELAEAMDEMRGKMLNTIPSGADKENLKKIFEDFSMLTSTVKIKQGALLGILSNLLTLVGVFLMYRMRRKGLGFYFIGIGVYIASPVILYGFNNIAGVGFFIFSLFIGLLFSFLYWRMRKYMA